MNPKLLLISLAVAGLSSCSTAYKISQTPDDVYFSPAPPQNEYVIVNNDENRDVYNSSGEDREIRRRINNRRWRRYDDNVYDNPYAIGYPNSYPYAYSNYPYAYSYPYGYYPPVYVNPKTSRLPTYTGPRKYNLGTYTKPSESYSYDPKTGKQIINPVSSSANNSVAKPRTNGSGVGNFIRKVFSNPNTNTYNNDNSNQSSRTFEPSRNTNTNTSTGSSSTSSSTQSSSGGNAPVRSFK